MQPPFLGTPLYDGAAIVVCFFIGLWLTVRYESKFGWLIMAVCAFWGWKIYQLL